MKKALILIGLIISVALFGDILIIVTKNGVIANWGAIIIPSFVAGIIINVFVNSGERKKFYKIAAASTVVTKIILMLLFVKNPTALAILLMLIVYYGVSYLFISLGGKILADKKEKDAHSV